MSDVLVPYEPPPPTVAERRELREVLVARQRGLCRRCERRPKRGIFELVAVDGVEAALCRSCGRKLDAPTRIPKAVATRKLPVALRPRHPPAAAPARSVVLAEVRTTAGLARGDRAAFIAWRVDRGWAAPEHEGCGGQLTRVEGSPDRLRCTRCLVAGVARSFLPPPIGEDAFDVITPEELVRWAGASFRRAPVTSTVLLNFDSDGAEPGQ